MKTLHTIITATVFAAAAATLSAQNYPDEYLGLPGDNLNLYAVMNLFQGSETLEAFERSLNDEESRINNLDLNGDNLIDYITVSDFVEGNVHNIVLRTALNRNDQQDIAVFVVEQLRNGEVQIQLIGDEALYGPNYIVEPIYAETPNPGYTGTVYTNNVVTTTYYDIAAWPVVRFIYFPGYRAWRSAWYWGYYPSYWRPWRPYYWHYYYGYHSHYYDYYYSHYHHWNHYRCPSYHNYYRSHVRVYSPTVVVNINKGNYRSTYSRPDQRRAGEELYARTAKTNGPANQPAVRTSNTTNRSAGNTRSADQHSVAGSSRSSSQATTNRSTTGTTRSATPSGSSYSRSSATRSTPQNNGSSSRTYSTGNSNQNRSSANRQSSASSASQRSTSSETRSASPQRSSQVVRSSTPSGSKQEVARQSSTPSRSSSPAVKSSSPSGSSSGQATRSSSSSGRSSSPAVKSSSPSGRSSSSAVKSSSPSGRSSSSAVKSSSPSGRSSSPAAKSSSSKSSHSSPAKSSSSSSRSSQRSSTSSSRR